MAHLDRDNKRLVQRVRRIRGQVEAIERALESGNDCGELLQLIAAVRGATASLMGEVLEDHLRFHVVDPDTARSAKQGRAAQQLIDVLKTYLR